MNRFVKNMVLSGASHHGSGRRYAMCLTGWMDHLD